MQKTNMLCSSTKDWVLPGAGPNIAFDSDVCKRTIDFLWWADWESMLLGTWEFNPLYLSMPLHIANIYIYIYLLHYIIKPPLNINARLLINKEDWLPNLVAITN
jgi:hypothetical protein